MGNDSPKPASDPRSPVGVQRETLEVKLNVYDLTSNEHLSRMGFGIYHSGIVIYNYEFGFGGSSVVTDESVPGIFTIPPGTATPNLKVTLLLGHSVLTRQQVSDLLAILKREWPACSYHVLKRNCNHFSEAFAERLGVGKAFPAWVNRAARFGNALLPDALLERILEQLAPPPAPPAPPEPMLRQAPPPAVVSRAPP
eukprot:RCo011949